MFGNIVPYASENFQIFINNNTSPTTTGGYGTISYDEYVWNKPRDIKMVSIFCVGGGGAGGLGAAGGNGTARGGGGGGGSGAIFTVTYPAKILPNTLLVAPSSGALPTNIRTGSSVGTDFGSAVFMDDLATLVALAKTGGNGGDTSTTTAGAAGAGGQSTVLGTDIEFARFGNYRSQIGLAGGAGGAGAAANAGGGFTALATFCLTGGGGGGSITTGNAGGAGGAILSHASGLYPGVAGGIAGGGMLGPGDGNNGYTRFGPFVSVGGTGGGGGATSVTGGNGGTGGIGCGGGGSGGGATNVGVNYSWPGNGGPGMVIISCW